MAYFFLQVHQLTCLRISNNMLADKQNIGYPLFSIMKEVSRYLVRRNKKNPFIDSRIYKRILYFLLDKIEQL